MTRILLAEDHPVMRSGVKFQLQSMLSNVIIDEADNFKKLLNAISTQDYSLIVMDIGIPGGNSIRMIDNVRARNAAVKILIYSALEEDTYALSFVRRGANGFLSKEAPTEELRVAVETILFRDKIYLSEKLREESLNLFVQASRKPAGEENSLTIREKEIADLLLAGKRITEAAHLLNLHPSTVSTHRHRIFGKMGVDNMMDLVRKLKMLDSRDS